MTATKLRDMNDHQTCGVLNREQWLTDRAHAVATFPYHYVIRRDDPRADMETFVLEAGADQAALVPGWYDRAWLTEVTSQPEMLDQPKPWGEVFGTGRFGVLFRMMFDAKMTRHRHHEALGGKLTDPRRDQ